MSKFWLEQPIRRFNRCHGLPFGISACYNCHYKLNNSDMSDDFIMEGFQMDAMNGYEDAISGHLASKSTVTVDQ